MYEAIKWPPDITPNRSPIHFTNEVEVAASPEKIWSCSWITPLGPASILALSVSSCSTDTGRYASHAYDAAATPVRALVEQLGFAPVWLVRLAEGGALVQARDKTWAPLIFQDLVKNAS